MMYDLDRKLLDLNKQILSYKLAINQGIDPRLANSILTNSMNEQYLAQNLPPPVPITEPAQIVEPVEEAVIVSETVSEEEIIPEPVEHIARGPRGKRGKRGPQGKPGLPGIGINSLPIILIEHNYNAPKECAIIVVNSLEDITVTLPDEVEDGKVIMIKSLPNPANQEDRKITLKCESAGMIEGEFSFVMQYANECLSMMCIKGDWFILNHYSST